MPFSTISVLSGEASFILSYIVAGLKFANKPNDSLNFKRPDSGLLSPLHLSHFGPPTAPSNTASFFRQVSTVLLGRGSPISSIAHPPANTYSQSNL